MYQRTVSYKAPLLRKVDNAIKMHVDNNLRSNCVDSKDAHLHLHSARRSDPRTAAYY